MSSGENFIGLTEKADSIDSIYSHLVQVKNMTPGVLQVMKGRYMMGRTYALVDPNDTMVAQLLDNQKLSIVKCGITQGKMSTESSVLPQGDGEESKPKRKSRKKASTEEKQNIEQLGNLFK